MVFAPFDKECNEFPGMAIRGSGEVQDILDYLPAIIEAQPELLIVKGKCNILACRFGILVMHQVEEECTLCELSLRSPTPATAGRWRIRRSTFGLISRATSVPSIPAVIPKSPRHGTG